MIWKRSKWSKRLKRDLIPVMIRSSGTKEIEKFQFDY